MKQNYLLGLLWVIITVLLCCLIDLYYCGKNKKPEATRSNYKLFTKCETEVIDYTFEGRLYSLSASGESGRYAISCATNLSRYTGEDSRINIRSYLLRKSDGKITIGLHADSFTDSCEAKKFFFEYIEKETANKERTDTAYSKYDLPQYNRPKNGGLYTPEEMNQINNGISNPVRRVYDKKAVIITNGNNSPAIISEKSVIYYSDTSN